MPLLNKLTYIEQFPLITLESVPQISTSFNKVIYQMETVLLFVQHAKGDSKRSKFQILTDLLFVKLYHTKIV